MAARLNKTCAWCKAPFATTQARTVTCSVSCGRRYINDQKRRRCPSPTAVWLERVQRWVDPTLGIVYSHSHFQEPVITPDSDGYLAVSGLTQGGKKLPCKGHHLVWEAVHGENAIPDGMVINHINFDRLDNRIDNLEVVTPKKNIEHSAQAGRLRNHSGSTNPTSKLREDDIVSVFERLAAGETLSSVALSFGVSDATVSLIKNRKTWTHVSVPEEVVQAAQQTRRKISKDDIIPIFKRLDQGEKAPEIAADYGVASSYITKVKNREVFSDVPLGALEHVAHRRDGNKLTADEVRYIRACLADGDTHKEIADDLKVSKATISLITRNKIWTDIT